MMHHGQFEIVRIAGTTIHAREQLKGYWGHVTIDTCDAGMPTYSAGDRPLLLVERAAIGSGSTYKLGVLKG